MCVTYSVGVYTLLCTYIHTYVIHFVCLFVCSQTVKANLGLEMRLSTSVSAESDS